jgi:hypothetical protein
MSVCGASIATLGGVRLAIAHLDPMESGMDPTPAVFLRAATAGGDAGVGGASVVAAGAVARAVAVRGVRIAAGLGLVVVAAEPVVVAADPVVVAAAEPVVADSQPIRGQSHPPDTKPAAAAMPGGCEADVVVTVWHMSRVGCAWLGDACARVAALIEARVPCEQLRGGAVAAPGEPSPARHQAAQRPALGAPCAVHGPDAMPQCLAAMLARAAWDAAGRDRQQLTAGLPEAPEPPEPEDCCGEGCMPCVFDRHETQMERHADLEAHVHSVAAAIELANAG